MNCVHSSRANEILTLCRLFGEWRSVADCATCPKVLHGTALPLVGEESETSPVVEIKCLSLGEVLADEPCSCGSATRISIHACHSPDRVRNWQQHAWCVPLQLNWDRLADPMARTSFRCCEACEFRHVSAAPDFRYGSDDQHDPNQAVEP